MKLTLWEVALLREAAHSPNGKVAACGHAMRPAMALAQRGLLVDQGYEDYRISKAGRAILSNPVTLGHERALKRRGIYREIWWRSYLVATDARSGRSPDEVYEQVQKICTLLNELRELGGSVPPREDASDQ